MFSLLKRNCLSNGLPFIICKQEGIGEIDGSHVLYVSTNNNKGGNSFIQQENLTPGEKVKISTLDTNFDTGRFQDNPVLVKVDVEGLEAR